MNLQHKKISDPGHRKAQETSWYHTPEAETPAASAQQTLFEPSTAERILARAGALQEIHGQLLSEGQIEAAAQEIGIQPEFVRLVIEQEHAVNVLPPRYAVEAAKERRLFANARVAVIASLGVSLAYNALANALFSDLYYGIHRSEALWWLACIFPALLAFSYGVLFRSRRAGAATGVLLGATITVALLFNFGFIGHSITMGTAELLAVVAMTGSGALLGAVGAQARRVVSRRQVSNRRRIIREATN